MSVRKLFLSVAILVSAAFFSANVMSQEGQKKPDMSMGMGPEVMARIMPNQHHKHLEPMAGTWNVKSKFWMFPGGEPQEAGGKSVKTMILGGRYLEEKYEGNAMGMPFSGVGILGYDNMKKKFSSSWIDSLSTTMMIALGTADASGKTITFVSEDDDPFTGSRKKHRTVYTIINNDKHIMEMFEMADGKEFKNMEIVYTRK